MEWLAVPPAFSTLRVNTFAVSSSEALMQVVKQLKEVEEYTYCNTFQEKNSAVYIHFIEG